jgi:uncharacterized iron-regulated protein
VLALGCAGEQKSPAIAKPESTDDDVVERSSLPLQLALGERTGTLSELAPELARASAVCIGESHDNPHHHFAQRELTRALMREAAGRPLAVGFEMFQRPFQAALDTFSKDGDAQKLIHASEFETRWGHAFQYYAPLLEAGRAAGATLLALNASKELSKAMAKGGPDALPEGLRPELPSLATNDPEHRAFFEAAMGMSFSGAKPSPHGPTEAQGAHGGHAGLSLENLYLAQLVWDETMAETASRWLAAHSDGLLVVIAGAGHCHESAVPRRIERRGPYPTLSARAVLRSELGKSDAPADSAFELLVILEDAPLALSLRE